MLQSGGDTSLEDELEKSRDEDKYGELRYSQLTAGKVQEELTNNPPESGV